MSQETFDVFDLEVIAGHTKFPNEVSCTLYCKKYCLFINTFKHEYKCPLGLTYFQWNSGLPLGENKSMTSAMLSATFSDETKINYEQ